MQLSQDILDEIRKRLSADKSVVGVYEFRKILSSYHDGVSLDDSLNLLYTITKGLPEVVSHDRQSDPSRIVKPELGFAMYISEFKRHRVFFEHAEDAVIFKLKNL